MKKINLMLFVGLLMVMFTSCDKDDPKIPNEEEVITTLTFKLTPTGGGDPLLFAFRDLDGDGGNPPVITNAVLAANASYTGELQLLNELEDPAEDITEEIAEEDDEHQFFFETSIAGFLVDYDDEDGDGNPIGIKTNIRTGDAATGTLKITLRHEPDKNAAGVSAGDISNAGGETDIEVVFSVEVQ